MEAILTEALPAEQREGFEAGGLAAAMPGRAGFSAPHLTAAAPAAGWRKRLAIAREVVAALTSCSWTIRPTTWTSPRWRSWRTTEFPGALVLLTRHRLLLERVSTPVLALDGRGGATGDADYAQREAAREESEQVAEHATNPLRRSSPEPPSRRAGLDERLLAHLERREWEGVEETILAAEEALRACRAAVEEPAVASNAIALADRWAALEAARAEVDRLYRRWAELEEKQR